MTTYQPLSIANITHFPETVIFYYMGAKTFKPVLRVKNKTDKEGIINIRVTTNRVPSHHSLKIKIPVKYWNERAGEVRKNDVIDYNAINAKIKERLDEMEAYDGQEAYAHTLNTKASYISYFENEYLPRKSAKPGTYIKYQMILKKVKAYRDDRGRKDILFNEIDTKMVHDLHRFMLKKCSANTANHYLKLIRQVLDKAIAENFYTYIRHPFLSIEFKNNKVQKNALAKEGIKRLIGWHIEESDLLYSVRNKFLFQLFMQGMRVSDLQLLRWNMIKGNHLDYVMLKTGTHMSVYINDVAWSLLCYQFRQFCIRENLRLIDIERLDAELMALKEAAAKKLRKSYGYTKGFDLLTYETTKEPILKEIEIKKEQLFHSLVGSICFIAKEKRYKDKFIFDFLKNEDFINVRNNNFRDGLTENQYKTLKNKSVVYNRHLKDLQARAGLDTVLTSHIPRHTYAHMMASAGESIYDIGMSLGHVGGLQVTEKYLSGFKLDNTSEANKRVASQFKV